MFPEIGQFSLILAVVLAFLQFVLPCLGAYKNNLILVRSANSLALGQAFFVGIAFFTLLFAFVNDDFSVAYVAANSNTHLPLFYKMTAVWSAHEGSILLWTAILALWTTLVVFLGQQIEAVFLARVLAVMGAISFGFLLFMLLTSNPFIRLLPNFPVDGNDLNPLLQDPGLVIHPPILYMGYVGTTVAFAFAMAALMAGKVEVHWAKWSLPWTIAAWCFLTWGITLGSWWAYRDLGWGGWWFWDPVENASFMPWLVTTALIHALVVTSKNGAFKNWTLLLAIIAFLLSLIGTFLVRSGILTSVHAFAVDPKRGAYLLEFLGIVILFAFTLYGFRAPKVGNAVYFEFVSKESLLLANTMLLFVLMLTVLLGTLYPLFLQVFHIAKISVGPPYFNMVFMPLVSVMFFFMGFAPACQWQKSELKIVLRQVGISFFLAIAMAFFLPWLITQTLSFKVVLGLGLAFWVLLSCLQDIYWRTQHFRKWRAPSYSFWAMIVAHIGVAVTVIGITLNTQYTSEDNLILPIGRSQQANHFQIKLLEVKDTLGSNYEGVEAKFLLMPGEIIITASKRFYPVSQAVMTVPGIDIGLWRDIYIALGAQTLDHQGYEVRIYEKPFIRWIWYGGLMMVLGGLIAIFPDLKKVLRYFGRFNSPLSSHKRKNSGDNKNSEASSNPHASDDYPA